MKMITRPMFVDHGPSFTLLHTWPVTPLRNHSNGSSFPQFHRWNEWLMRVNQEKQQGGQ